jgi:NAD(P)-dependent dehydrogenase (short-subunit alcohol dehydrogenase family)
MTRTAVIVGATGGIGAACARELRDRGFALLLNGRREDVLRELGAELGADVVAGDCALQTTGARIVERLDSVDLLVHAAGVLRGGPVRHQPVEVFEDVLRTNLTSVYVVVHACLPLMSAGARIVLISSSAATQPMRGLTAYSAAKAGMNAFARALAAEVERDGINVSLVSPGPVDTPMMGESINRFTALEAADVGAVVGWLSDLPPRIVLPDIIFRAPFSGPFAGRMAGGGEGSAGMAATGDRPRPA